MQLEELGLVFVPSPYVNPEQFRAMEDWISTAFRFRYVWSALPDHGLGLVVNVGHKDAAEHALKEALAYALDTKER